MIVRALPGASFGDGTASVDAVAEIGDPGTREIVDTFSTNEDVEVAILEG